jgi:hypothetical protein
MRLLAVGFTLPVIGALLSLYVPGWVEAYKRRPVALPAAEREKVRASLDRAKQSFDKHEAAFRAFWPKMVEGTVGARPDKGKCPLRIPVPATRTINSPLGSGGPATVVEGNARAPVRWLLIDATERAVSAGIGAAVPPFFTALGGKSTKADAPVSTVRLDDFRVMVADLEKQIDVPIPLPDHAEVVERALRIAGEKETVLDFVVVVHAWIPPRALGSRAFSSGAIWARAYLWLPFRDEAVCAADLTARNSKDLVFVANLGDDSNLKLTQDLVTRFADAFAHGFVGVGPTEPPALPTEVPAE